MTIKNGPGSGGFPIEFCKMVWSVISCDSYIKCVNKCFENDEMCSQKQAIIALTEKKGKDLSLLEK